VIKQVPAANELDVLYEDNHLLIINKQPSQLVQGDKTADKSLKDLVGEYLKEKYHKPGNVYVGVAHRLDRPVSGTVIFAKTSKALSRMNEKFKHNQVKKTYWAIVQNPPPAQTETLIQYLLNNEKLNKSFIQPDARQGAKEASLTYRLLYQFERYYLLAIDLHTGRHHQIRAQLAAMGCPIKGDLKYGAPRSNPDGSIHLHARQIVFTHPVKKIILTITAAPPAADKLWQLASARFPILQTVEEAPADEGLAPESEPMANREDHSMTKDKAGD
jgi:23S rRNA pseudouridine1911/1915/1917 synthase